MTAKSAEKRDKKEAIPLKKRILSLVLCLALLPLPGCAAMLERGHETVTTHVDYAVTEDESVLRAETYQGLVSAMLYFVNEHRRGGTIRLYNYTGDVEADLANARDEVMYEDPLGAFSIHGLTYDFTRILTYYEVELRITYSRTAQEVNSLREVTGLAGVRQELKRLVTGQESSTAFLASYFSGDAELVRQLLGLACLSSPELFRHHDVNAMDMDITLYPEAGTRRVIEMKLGWSQSAGTVAEQEKEYAQQLEDAAAALLEANPPVGEGYTVEELAAIVRAAAGPPDDRGSPLALDALAGEPASDSGLLMAMEYLCQQCSIEVEPVANPAGGLWLIVSTPAGYRHLLPQSLYHTEDGVEPGETAPSLPLYTDQELTEMGYEWPNSLHPACEDYTAVQSLDGSEAGPPAVEE